MVNTFTVRCLCVVSCTHLPLLFYECNCRHRSSSDVLWFHLLLQAMFELVTSEASYYKSLEILETHFLRNPVLVNTLSQSDMHFLFSNIEEVMKASERWDAFLVCVLAGQRLIQTLTCVYVMVLCWFCFSRFLMDLEHRIEESILISDVCDIVYHHAVEHFSVFIKYVINQVYQEKNYRRILWVAIFFSSNWCTVHQQQFQVIRAANVHCLGARSPCDFKVDLWK